MKELKTLTTTRKLLLNDRNYNCGDIENLTEKEANKICLVKKEIKEHQVYFIDFGGYFGFSAVVFKNNHNIKHAHLYQLHYKYSYNTITKLYKRYIEILNNKLYTDEELTDKNSIKTYDDITRRRDYLHNLYGLRYDYISCFNYFKTKEEEEAYDNKIKDMILNPVCFGYMSKDLKPIIKKMLSLHDELLEIENNLKQDYQYLYEAFKYEMFNHEYCYNAYQANWDVLSALYGEIEYNNEDDRTLYYKQLNFNDIQIKAYEDARRYVIEHFEY